MRDPPINPMSLGSVLCFWLSLLAGFGLNSGKFPSYSKFISIEFNYNLKIEFI